MNKIQTLDYFQGQVAKKYLGGTKLVTGHLKKYYDEAAELYAKQFIPEVEPDRIVLTEEELKEKMKDAFEAAREMQITGWEEGEDTYKSFEQFWNLYNKEEGK